MLLNVKILFKYLMFSAKSLIVLVLHVMIIPFSV